MKALLDVNVLIALLDSSHVHHEKAREWLKEHIALGWASCPLTQNGCLRILSQPSYPQPLSLLQAAAALSRAQSTQWYEFWPDSVSTLDARSIDLQFSHGGAQLTDIYLLALATQRGGRLLTFDQRISLKAVPNARPENLVVL